MQQTRVLLCLGGALTMVLIGDSLPHAFGIAGAAAVIRFRTPIDDPRDASVLFLLMALGMATGLALWTVAAVGTLFLCGYLAAVGRARRESPRSMKVALVADGDEFPAAHVSRVFDAHHIVAETVEFARSDRAVARYRAVVDDDASLDRVSIDLLGGGTAGLASVSWEASKKRT